MRVRALSILLAAGLLVPSTAFALEGDTASSDPAVSTTTGRDRPAARPLTTTVGTDSAASGESASPDSVVLVPIGRWLGCPAYGGLCVLDSEAVAAWSSDASAAWSGSVEDWRPLVEAFFAPSDVARAMSVIDCESGGDPNVKNRYSSASGLFQHLGSFWGGRSDAAGYGGSDVFDPLANVAVAAWLVYDGGGWTHWDASRGCWG